jgi:hypothetical protein
MEINQQDQEWIDSSIDSGKKYGFPECCIKEFISITPSQMEHRHPNNKEILRVKMSYVQDYYTGFIPCFKHAMDIKKGLIKLGDLINKSKRISRKHFPFGNEFK